MSPSTSSTGSWPPTVASCGCTTMRCRSTRPTVRRAGTACCKTSPRIDEAPRRSLAATRSSRRRASPRSASFVRRRGRSICPEVLTRLGLAGEATRCAVFRNHSLSSGELGVSIVDAWLSEGHRLEDDAHRERLRVGIRRLRPVGHGDVRGAIDPRARPHLPAGGARGPRGGEALDPIPRGHPDLRRRRVVGLHQLRSRERRPTLVGSRHGGAQPDREHDRRRDRARARDRPPRRGPGAVPHPDRTVARRHLHRGARDRRRELLEPADRGAARLHERRVGIPCAMGRGDPPRGSRTGRGARREARRHRRAVSRRIPDADEERRGRVGARRGDARARTPMGRRATGRVSASTSPTRRNRKNVSGMRSSGTERSSSTCRPRSISTVPTAAWRRST